MRPVIIICSNPTPRFRYICNHIFRYRMGVYYEITDLPTSATNAILINYCSEPLSGALHIKPSGLLENKLITQFNPPHIGMGPDWKLFPDDSSLLKFDLFAACFWVLSRYEEYGPFEPDEHVRFSHLHSLLFEVGALDMPIVDIWIAQLAKAIGLTVRNVGFKTITTVDIDQVYLWKNKGLRRQAILLAKNFADFHFLKACLSTAFHKKTDPYDNWQDIIALNTSAGSEVILFFHLGNYGPHDKNVLYTASVFQNAFSESISAAIIGIHPSYASNFDNNILQTEIGRFNDLFQEHPARSRQHYLMLRLPQTYQTLIKCGIDNDYTMGYSSICGFRAGTAYPFQWYDLQNESSTNLTVHPFEAMDVALRFSHQFSANQASEILTKRLKMAQTEGRPFCYVIHNESWSGIGAWKGWDFVFKKLLTPSQF